MEIKNHAEDKKENIHNNQCIFINRDNPLIDKKELACVILETLLCRSEKLSYNIVCDVLDLAKEEIKNIYIKSY